jgi:hypothetical protein
MLSVAYYVFFSVHIIQFEQYRQGRHEEVKAGRILKNGGKRKIQEKLRYIFFPKPRRI